jgi:hypothetical protein
MDFLKFLGDYWWLIFPIMGVAGGAAKTWERSAKARHERRLETLRAKAEIKSAQAEARALARQRPARTAQPVEPSHSEVLQRLFAAHDEVTARWLDYELDVAKLIAFPAMSDGRQELTAAFLRAKKVADRLRPASADQRVTKEELDEYRNAVTDYEVAFDVAERDARRIKDSSFSAAERKRLDTAKQLLGVAVDQAATPAERQVAYKRVREELDGLISLSDEAVEVLEKKVALQLPAGSRSFGADSAAKTAQNVPQMQEPAPQRTETPDATPWPVPRRDGSAPRP